MKLTPIEQQNTIHRLVMKICIENIYNFPKESIMSSRIHPPDTLVVCNEAF